MRLRIEINPDIAALMQAEIAAGEKAVCQRQSKSEPKGSAKCCHFGVGIISV